MTTPEGIDRLYAELYGTKNPIKVARLANKLTQHELASYLHITDQVIVNVEQGLLQSLPQTIEVLLEVPQSAYNWWVIEERKRNEPFFRHATVRQDLAVTDRWVPFRLSVSRSFRGFCRKAVLQPSILRDFELYRQRSRSPIRAALSGVGLSEATLSELGLSP